MGVTERRLTRLEEAGMSRQAHAHYLRKLADELETEGCQIVSDVQALRMAARIEVIRPSDYPKAA